jgi:hypothetical protein
MTSPDHTVSAGDAGPGAPDALALYGIDADTSALVWRNPFRRSAAYVSPSRTVVVGRPGSGKSFWAEVQMAQMASHGVLSFAVDPLDDYGAWMRRSGGQVIEVGDPALRFNPLARRAGEGAGEYTARLLPLALALAGEPAQSPREHLLALGLDRLCALGGEGHRSLSDLVSILSGIPGDDMGDMPQRVAAIGTEGPLAAWLTQESTISAVTVPGSASISLRGICFDDAALAAGSAVSVMLAASLAEAAHDRGRRAIVVVDEMHRALSAPAGAHFSGALRHLEIVCRGLGAPLLLIGQITGDARVDDALAREMSTADACLLTAGVTPQVEAALSMLVGKDDPIRRRALYHLVPGWLADLPRVTDPRPAILLADGEAVRMWLAGPGDGGAPR